HLYAYTGECIFNVGTKAQTFSKGIVEAVCEIPGNFLNDGSYVISVMMVKDTSQVLFNLEEIISFDIQDYREGVTWYGKWRSEEHTSELQSRENLVCRLLLE